ncbi:MAG: alpha/beta fold hydrolase [Ignavibacteria bacterium]
MINYRTYGNPSYKIAVLHGGPGAPGYMASVARELSKNFGIIEPMQTADSVQGQADELYNILHEHAQLPVTLIGHSWGGFLSLVFASKYPENVSKLILVDSGPFEDKYVVNLRETRNSRLSENEREEIKKIELSINKTDETGKRELLVKLGNLSSRADSFEPIPANSEVIEYQAEIHNKVWGEAVKMRTGRKFVEIIKNLKIPVTAIHGDYDPHPFEGVSEPFKKYVKNFNLILLKKCGHYPWLEKNAKDKFYAILNAELHQI